MKKIFDIPNFPNYQLIDFDTSEMVINKITGQPMQFILNNKGYLKVRLSNEGIRFNYLIHILKYECYFGYQEDLHGHNSKNTLDHDNDNKLDNRIRNLKKMSRRENTQKRRQNDKMRNSEKRI